MSLGQKIYETVKDNKSETGTAVATGYFGGGFIDDRLIEGNLVEMPSPMSQLSEFTGNTVTPDKFSHLGFSAAASKGIMTLSDRAGISPEKQFALINTAALVGGSAFEMKVSKNYSQADMYANLIGANAAYIQHNGREAIERIKSGFEGIKERLGSSEESIEDTYGSSSKFDLLSNQEEQKRTFYDSTVESYLTEDVESRTDIQEIIDDLSSTIRDEDETAYLATRMMEKYGGALKKDVEDSKYEEDIQEMVSNIFNKENLNKEEKTKRALTATVNRYEFDYAQDDKGVDKIETTATKPTVTGKLNEKVDKIENKQRFDNESYGRNSSAILS